MNPQREDREKKDRFPTFEVDVSGTVMLNTLEYYAFVDGWSTKKQFLEDPIVAGWENPLPGTRANVRFLRYTRAGLLSRRRTEAKYEFEYKLTPKGLDRYEWLLKSRGLLNPADALNDDEKERMLVRWAVIKLRYREEKVRLASLLSPTGRMQALERGLIP